MFAERLQRLAATAPNIGAVQEAVALAFPPSQGSAKRAEKFKQFCSDVMPPGTKFKVPRLTLPHLNICAPFPPDPHLTGTPSAHMLGAKLTAFD